MTRKTHMIMLLPLLLITVTLLVLPAKAATITVCYFDKDVYNQGQTGYITLSVYNDKDEKIQVTELTATVEYYYNDENLYLQTFYNDVGLPTEVLPGDTESFTIPFSLPTNIAPGYPTVLVRAKTELWNDHAQAWYSSEHPTSRPVLYIESPYKHLFEDQTETNDQLQTQIHDLEAVNTMTTNVVYLLAASAAALAAILVFIIMLNRRARITPRPAV